MKFRDLVSSKHMCYLTGDYDMYRMSRDRAHFSHSTLTTEMASLVPVNFRTLYDFNLNEAINVYDCIYVYDFST